MTLQFLLFITYVVTMASGSNDDTLNLDDSGVAECSTPIKYPYAKTSRPYVEHPVLVKAKKLVDEGKEKDAYKSLYDDILLHCNDDQSRSVWNARWIDLDKYIENKSGKAIFLSFNV